MKKLDKTTLYLGVFCIVALIATIAVYSKLPQTIATHFNIDGEVDKYSDKSAVFITGVLPLAILILMTVLPKIDPRSENYQRFKVPYAVIKTVTVVFLIGIHGLMVLYTLKVIDNPSSAISFLVALLFIAMGNYLPKVKHNYFVGIRTPWTLASETSWRITNRIAGYMFTALGLLTVISLFIAQKLAYYLMVGGALGTAVVVTIISYIVFKNEKNSALK